MKKYIFTIAFALLGITSSMASKADTLRIYSIDGERIPNWEGLPGYSACQLGLRL